MSPHPWTDQHYDETTFEDIQANDATLDGIRFHDCRFVRCQFSEATLTRCRFSDVEFRECNLSLALLTDSRFDGCRFVDCKMVGIDWTRAHWPRIRTSRALAFHRCVLNDSSFFGLDLREYVLTECRAVDVDFTEANCETINFEGSDLRDSVFARTRLVGANFLRAEGYRIDIFNNDIRRAHFSLPEAMALLDSLDIELEG